MEEKTRQLGEKPIACLLWNFSLPAIIGMLASSSYTIINRLLVGNIVGPDAIAGISVSMPISFVLMAFGVLVGVGSGALISIRLGQQKRDEAEQILGNAFTLILIIAVIVSGACLFFLDPLLKSFGASAEVLPYAREFIRIILWGSIFQYLSFGLSNIIRAEGNPRTAMIALLINAALNIILGSIFVYFLGYGIKGTAVATVISQAVSAAWVLAHFRSKNSVLRLRFKHLGLKWNLLKGILAIGMAPFSIQMAASVVNIFFNQDLSRYGGDAAIAAFGIINAITMFIIMPVFGINQGAQPIIGYNYGAQRYERVNQALKLSIAAATIVVTVGFVLVQLFPTQLLRAFTSDGEVLSLGIPGIRMVLLVLPVVGLQIVIANFFQAINKAGKSMILSILRQVIILIPMLIILPQFLGLKGVWLASPIADFTSAVVTTVLLAAELRHLNKLAEPLSKPDTGMA